MNIKRIQVEEGFLNGLDLEFSEGLNVIIGPRGSGKTSIIELIRFCLGVEAFSTKFNESSREHALAVLGSGQVTLSIQDNGNELIVSRSSDEVDYFSYLEINLPIILSQNEIETLGLHEQGRLRLIDSFTKTPYSYTIEEQTVSSDIKSLTVQLTSLIEEIQNIEDQIELLKGINKELESAEKERFEILGSIESIKPQQEELSKITDNTVMLSVQESILNRTSNTISDWITGIEEALLFPPSIEKWPESGGKKDLLENIRKHFEAGIDNINKGIHSIKVSENLAKDLAKQANQSRIEFENRARELRNQIEEVQEGAGLISRRISDLREKMGQLEALKKIKIERKIKVDEIESQRSKKLDQLDKLKEDRFKNRNLIINDLNNFLSPEIEIKAIRSAQYTKYESAIIEMLRGSGLKYSSLAPKLAQTMSPRELGEAIEKLNYKNISKISGITEERAQKLVAYNRTTGIEQIYTAHVEDGIKLTLLVGNSYKPTEEVSTGQRCTVILPILLCNHGKSLIIDQPEDHLDNAFIVDTVIKSIREASQNSQIICSTHNPNIPVLGEAELVILLDSDGKRGFVRNANYLDHPSTVEAISNVMEGGREAFLERAKFYNSIDY